MPIDYPRLVAGLSAVTAMVGEGTTGLAALEVLTGSARVAIGASGATYTEYVTEPVGGLGATSRDASRNAGSRNAGSRDAGSRDAGSAEDRPGGRVVIADGTMAWALGQPAAHYLMDPHQPVEPALTRVDQLPPELAGPLLGRGVAALVGSAVRSGDQLHGLIHLYFDEPFSDVDPWPWREVRDAVRLVAGTAERTVGRGAAAGSAGPGSVRELSEQEDRRLFLALAGHELRTPATVLKGYAGLLADRWASLDEADRREAAQILSQRADELARLVDRLLGASVGDGGSGSLLRTVAFDPTEALRRAIRDLPAELARAVRTELPDGLPLASGDPGILRSVVAELVTNAVRYSAPAGVPTGGARRVPAMPGPVEVIAGADAQTVVIRVCDRGIGIEPTQVEQAFEMFWRARVEGDPGGGVGLGLYLVRRLVERQDGWVSLRPRQGGGTVAEVRLPRADGPLRRQSPGEA